MSEAVIRRHGLEPFLEDMSRTDASESAVQIAVNGGLGHINLRGNPADPSFIDAVVNVLGQSLPVTPNTLSPEPHRVFWLGPDEWLIVTAAERVTELAARLADATAMHHAAVNDIRGGQVALTMTGAGARDILAKGCALDLHASVFAAGSCAQTGLAKANVLLACLDDAPTFMIVVRRSFSDYLCHWLAHAGKNNGLSISDH